MASLSRINIIFRVNLDELSTQFQNAARMAKDAAKKFESYGRTLSTSVTLPLLAAAGASIKFASDMEQSQQKTDVVFGKYSDEVKKFAQTTLNAYGISETKALDMLSLYGDMSTSMGITRQKASEMSKTLVGLAGDIASFKNIGLDQAQTALNGIFSGETESLKMLGIIMTEANLQQYAYAQGINKKISAMTQDEKVMLRYNFVLNQTKNAHGDFQKEYGSAANQTRVFTEGIKEMGAQFGQIILPYFTKAVTVINGYLKEVMALSSEQKKWVVGIAAVSAAFGPVLLAMGKFMAAVPEIVNGFKSIRSAVIAMNAAFMANPITAITGLLAAFAAATVLAESRLSELANAQREFESMTKKAASTVSSEIAETRRLVEVARNKRLSDEERTRALNKLIEKSEEHFGKLTLETSGTNAAKKAVDAYTESLLKNARIKAAQEKLVEVQKRKVDLELGVSDETDPSIGQTLGNYAKSALYGMPSLAYEVERAKTRAKNAQIVRKELDALEAKLKELIGPQQKVNEETEDFTAGLGGVGGAADKTKKKIEDLGVIGSVKWMQAQIMDMEDAASKLDTTSDAYENLILQIKAYQTTLDAIQNPSEKITVGSEDWYQNEIDEINRLIKKLEVGKDAYNELIKQRSILQNTLSMAQNTDSSTHVEETFETGSQKWYEQEISGIKEVMSTLPIVSEKYKQLAAELSVLEKTYKMELDITDIEEKSETIKSLTNEIQSSMNSAFGALADGISESLGKAENGFQRFGQALVKNTIKALGAALAQSVGNGIMSATETASKTPFGAYLLPALIGAAVASVTAAFSGIPKFAEGGIVFGPTVGLMGEYAGASSNPEVIAPLNKLKDLIEPAGSGASAVVLSGEFRISGNDLILAIDRTNARKKRTE